MSTSDVAYLPDRALVKAVLAGDAAAFRQFFDENYDRLFRFLMPLLSNNHHAAEDVVQQTMSKALANLHTYRGEAQLFTWLCRVGRNQAVDWKRANFRHAERAVSLDENLAVRSEVAAKPDKQQNAPDSRAERDEQSAMVHEALDLLPPKYGDILEWKYIQGLTAKEIAARMEMGVEAVNSTLARAKRAFRDVYAQTDLGVITSSAEGDKT